MSILYITEFSNVGFTGGTSTQVAAQPANKEQAITISASSAQSNAFNPNTQLVRLHTDVICAIEFGTNPTAVANTGGASATARMAANQTEYFTVPMTGTYKVAVVASA